MHLPNDPDNPTSLLLGPACTGRHRILFRTERSQSRSHQARHSRLPPCRRARTACQYFWRMRRAVETPRSRTGASVVMATVPLAHTPRQHPTPEARPVVGSVLDVHQHRSLALPLSVRGTNTRSNFRYEAYITFSRLARAWHGVCGKRREGFCCHAGMSLVACPCPSLDVEPDWQSGYSLGSSKTGQTCAAEANQPVSRYS